MQVYGRGDLTFEERLAMERDYLDNLLHRRRHSVILLRTPRAIVRGAVSYRRGLLTRGFLSIASARAALAGRPAGVGALDPPPRAGPDSLDQRGPGRTVGEDGDG